MKHPAYNLKPNKHADRAVFLETTRRVFKAFGSEEKYRYVGLGGPFLEDFRLIHNAFPEMKLLSIEANEETHKRQEFHRFANEDLHEIRHSDVNEFVTNYSTEDFKENVWFDLYSLDDSGDLADIASLAEQLPVRSILRVTLPAEPKNIPGVADTQKVTSYLQNFRNKFGVLTPEKLQLEDFRDGDSYCSLLSKIFSRAIEGAFPPTGNVFFQPLCFSFYRDDTRMFSFCGIILERESGENSDRKKIEDAFSDWDLNSLDGDTIHHLTIPALSIKERLTLERFLPLAEDKTNKANYVSSLGYLLHYKSEYHEKEMERYASFYNLYPQFFKAQF